MSTHVPSLRNALPGYGVGAQAGIFSAGRRRSFVCVCLVCVCVCVSQWELRKGPTVLSCSTSMGRQAGFGPDSTRIKGFPTLYALPTHKHTHIHSVDQENTFNS